MYSTTNHRLVLERDRSHMAIGQLNKSLSKGYHKNKKYDLIHSLQIDRKSAQSSNPLDLVVDMHMGVSSDSD